jgi:hypothetical protein
MLQRLIDSSLADAIKAGCDCVQIKHDGIQSQFCVGDGIMNVINRFHHLPAEVHTLKGFDPSMKCTLIGTHAPTANRFLVYDCLLVVRDDRIVDLRKEPYRTRYVAAKIQCKLLGEHFHLVVNHAIGNAPALWKTLPYVPDGKGLIFRNSRDPAEVALRCKRYYSDRPMEELV